jgi:Family of unknown function (DUF5808)
MPTEDAKPQPKRKTIRRRVRRVRRVQRGVTATAFAALLARELRKPPEQRTWEGRLLGVPYSLRPPTLARARSRLWWTDGPLLVPKVFGIGWDLNLGRLFALVRRLSKP